ncbi:MAG: ABC transporter permease [Proteobacteria bacterium]|nr:ABC transporter permease [Desulfobulbaceae bacterium]MBU4153036.1 ABC transporter permease [Pseudomonadota bacterium]MDP2105278.1 ABC transporter permease [Desulfobulbaceae bacterium]
MKSIAKYVVKHRGVWADWSNNRYGLPHLLLAAAGIAGFFLVWAIGGNYLFNRPHFGQFSGFLPVATIKALGRLLFDLQFWPSVLASLRRVTVGIGIAFVLGLPLGLLIGYFRQLRTATYVPIQFVRMISPLSWMPIALLVFATFESAIYFLITMATIWPIVLNSSLGVSRVNPQWIRMAKNQGATDVQVLLYIVVPASVPYILTSLRLALGVAWIVLVPVEFLGISSGLGYIINDARDTMEYDRLMAIVMAIGMIGFILDGSIQLIQRVFRWNWVD